MHFGMELEKPEIQPSSQLPQILNLISIVLENNNVKHKKARNEKSTKTLAEKSSRYNILHKHIIDNRKNSENVRN